MPYQFTCQHCNAPFTSRSLNRPNRFCSRSCYLAHPRQAPREGIPQANGSVLVPLTKGLFAIIDAEDAERVLTHRWQADYAGGGHWHARRKVGGKRIWMHRYIIGAPDDLLVDHVNRNTLDNRRRNLRPATSSQNNANITRRKDNSSGFIGVTWHKRARRWYAQIQCNGRARHLGSFATALEAAIARDAAALELFGEFASLNFPCEVDH